MTKITADTVSFATTFQSPTRSLIIETMGDKPPVDKEASQLSSPKAGSIPAFSPKEGSPTPPVTAGILPAQHWVQAAEVCTDLLLLDWMWDVELTLVESPRMKAPTKPTPQPARRAWSRRLTPLRLASLSTVRSTEEPIIAMSGTLPTGNVNRVMSL